MYVHTRQSSWNTNSNTTESVRSQYERPAAYVIAQQYSSAKLVSMHFNSRTEKFGARLKKKLFHCRRVLLKNLRKPKMRVSVQSQWGPGGGDHKPVYPRSTSANTESQKDLI
jgi:hypothetical protein